MGTIWGGILEFGLILAHIILHRVQTHLPYILPCLIQLVQLLQLKVFPCMCLHEDFLGYFPLLTSIPLSVS